MSQENKARNFPGCNDPYDATEFLYSLSGETFVDVGASDGFYTIGLAQNWKRIYAFEPFPNTANYLRMRVTRANLSRVTVIEKAVTDKVGKDTFYVSSRGWRCHSLLPVGVDEIEVETTTLAEELPEEEIDLIKVDVEGSEFEVVEGAREIADRIKAWFIEMHDLKEICGDFATVKGSYQSRSRAMTKLLKQMGYQTKWIVKNRIIYAWREE